VVEGDIAPLLDIQQATLISVPSTAKLPLEEFLLSDIAPTADEDVTKVVDMITKDELRANVVRLSAVFTRLATSTAVFEAQAWIKERLESLGLEVTTFPFRTGYSDNVIGDLKGAEDPTKIVVVSAHYDSRSTVFNADLRAPGADDNGSGSSNVLEIARAITKSGLKFKNTIRFCLWSGEEQGLIGSRAYAAKMKADGVNIIAVLNGDMLGWTLPRTNITVGMSNRFVSNDLVQLVNGITATYVPTLRIGPTSACCSDHQSFFEQGYHAVGYAENTGLYTDYPYYHMSTDLPEHLNFDQITLISKAIAAATATLAVPHKG